MCLIIHTINQSVRSDLHRKCVWERKWDDEEQGEKSERTRENAQMYGRGKKTFDDSSTDATDLMLWYEYLFSLVRMWNYYASVDAVISFKQPMYQSVSSLYLFWFQKFNEIRIWQKCMEIVRDFNLSGPPSFPFSNLKREGERSWEKTQTKHLIWIFVCLHFSQLSLNVCLIDSIVLWKPKCVRIHFNPWVLGTC